MTKSYRPIIAMEEANPRQSNPCRLYGSKATALPRRPMRSWTLPKVDRYKLSCFNQCWPDQERPIKSSQYSLTVERNPTQPIYDVLKVSITNTRSWKDCWHKHHFHPEVFPPFPPTIPLLVPSEISPGSNTGPRTLNLIWPHNKSSSKARNQEATSSPSKRVPLLL